MRKALILTLLCTILLAGSISAVLDVKSFDPSVPKHGEIKIKDWLGLSKKANYRLTDYGASVINVWAEGEYTLYKKTHLFRGIYIKDILGRRGELRDVKFYIWQNKTETRYRPVYESKCKEVYNETTKNQTEVCESVLVANESYEVDVSGWIPYKPGMDLEPGTGRWRLEAKRPVNKKVDFILEAHGKEFTEWAWWDTSWEYKREIEIQENSGNTLTDYSVLIHVPYDSDMQSDFDDLRFVDSSETTELGYWIENKTDSSEAWVWVKVPSIPASGTVSIYMYYGNPSVATTSNASDAFLFYEDFEGSLGTSPPDGWNDCSQSGNQFTVENIGGNNVAEADTGTGIACMNRSFASGYGYAWQWDVHIGDRLYADFYFVNDSNRWYVHTDVGSWNLGLGKVVSGSQSDRLIDAGYQWTAGTTHTVLVTRDQSGNWELFDNGTSVGTLSDTDLPSSWGWRLRLYSGNAATVEWYDNIIARRFYSPEPTYSIGDEQKSKPSVILNSPPDNYNSTTQAITFNATVTSTSGVANVSLIIDGIYNETNSSGISGDYIFQKTLSDGTHNWTVEGCDVNGNCENATVRTFTIDTIPPSLSISFPTGADNITDYTPSPTFNTSVNWSVSDTNLDSCWYNVDGGTNNSITCNDDFTITNLDYGTHTITIYANDTFGWLSSDSVTQLWDYKILENSREFSPSIYETETETYAINVSANSSLTSVILNWNNTNYTMENQGDNYWTYTRDMPIGTGNFDLKFLFIYDGEVIESDLIPTLS